jgi:hypothetical protein
MIKLLTSKFLQKWKIKKSTVKDQQRRVSITLQSQLKNMSKGEFKKNRSRKFIAYEQDGKQVFREELAKLPIVDIVIILAKIKYLSLKNEITKPRYINYDSDPDFGRIRINEYRIFIHRLDSKNWLMLHIFKKKTNKTPSKNVDISYNRLINYLNKE